MIKIMNLSKKYGNFYALKDVNLELPSKGLIGISGESGSGKTTLLNAIALMDNKYQGEIIINNKNILKYNKRKIDKYHLNIGYIFQTPYLFNFCTVKENIQFLSLIKGKKENINEILKLVGLSKYKNKKVNILSGGQRQRVSIAASLISKPKILLCDEPTGSLDSENSIKVMEILKEISKDILVVIVSHDLRLLKEYTDSIIYLRNGELVNKINYTFQNQKLKYQRKTILSYLKFIIKFAYKNIFNHRKRTLMTSFMISFGLIGLILSILLKDGFSSFFETSLGGYESNKYMYCYNVSNSEEIEVLLDTFEEDFKDYNNGYFYQYDFKENTGNFRNKIMINDKELYLNFNHLAYLLKDNKKYSDNEIGLCCSKEYIDYLCYVFNVDNLNLLNKELKKDNYELNFEYLDNYINLNFNLKLINVKESNNEYTYFIHSSPLFLKKYFERYLSLSLNDESKITILPYIQSEEKDKNELLLSEEKKKYDYVFDNEIYDQKYDFVFKSNYYRMDYNIAKEMGTMINSNYFFSMDKGIDMMGYFNENIKISSNYLEISGESISFIPNDYTYNSLNEISISKGLYDLLKSENININIDQKTCNFKVKEIIDNDKLVIYQNSEWSYLLFKELFYFKDYECIGLSIGFSKSDDESIKILSEYYKDFEFICPLKEVKKEINQMIKKIQDLLMILSSFCIIISLLLMSVIIFINTIEQSKNIALLRVNGISKKDVILIYLFEALLLGVISFVVSGYFSFVFSLELNLVFNSLLKNNEIINIIKIKKDTLINVFKLIVVMSFFSGIVPSLFAANKDSLKVLKN